MLSRSYARLVESLGNSRLMSSLYFTDVILEAQATESTVQQKLKEQINAAKATGNYKNNEEFRTAVDNLANYISDSGNMSELFTMISPALDPAQNPGSELAIKLLVGSRGVPGGGMLFRMLVNEPDKFKAKHGEVIDVWKNIKSILSQLAKDRQIPKDQAQKFAIELISQNIDTFLNTVESAKSEIKGESVPEAVKLPGTEILKKGPGMVILKFPKNGGADTVESLSAAGDMRPNSDMGDRGVCTRRSNPGGSRASNYLQKSTVYVKLADTDGSGEYHIQWQCHFDGSEGAEFKDHHDNDISGQLLLMRDTSEGSEFDVILKDIIKRQILPDNVTHEDLYRMVRESLPKSGNK